MTGWAWHPGDPDTDPVLTIRPAKGRGEISITATDTSTAIDNSGLLARPRGFLVPAEALRGFSGPLHVVGRNGRDLLGSPLDPRAELTSNTAAAATLARLYPAGDGDQRPLPLVAPPAIPVTANVAGPPAGKSSRRPPVDVVVPVHDGSAWCWPAWTACWPPCRAQPGDRGGRCVARAGPDRRVGCPGARGSASA